MSKTSIIKGYHGTEEQYVNDILKNGFTSNVRKDHWLGQGIYFYTELYLAQWWIETKIKNRNSYSKASVIEVDIVADESKILNLDSILGMNLFFKELTKFFTTTTISLKFTNKPIKNLCFAVDSVKRRLEISVVIKSFLKDNPSYGEQNIGSFEKDFKFNLPLNFAYLETQICVSDNIYIKNKKCCYPPRRTTWS
jgi:hypothetical protein